jgi:uncharacterized protein YbaP (TraB family)
VSALARDQHVLWTVEGQHNTVYLLGSIHVLRASDGGLPPVADAAYADAEQLVMEIDMDDAAAEPLSLLGSMQRAATLPAGTTLRGVLGADYAHVQAQALDAGLDLAPFDGYAPWFIAITLMTLELAKRGFDPALGIEHTLAARASSDHKPISGLETAEQQFAGAELAPVAEQKRFLLMSLEEAGHIDEELDSMLSAWRTGDTEKLATLLSSEFDKFPELYKPLTEDRNRPGWASSWTCSTTTTTTWSWSARCISSAKQQRRRPAASTRIRSPPAIVRSDGPQESRLPRRPGRLVEFSAARQPRRRT